MGMKRRLLVLFVMVAMLLSLCSVAFANKATAPGQLKDKTAPGQDPSFYRGITSNTSSVTTSTDASTTVSSTEVTTNSYTTSVTSDPYTTTNSTSTISTETKTLPTGKIQVRDVQTTVTTVNTNIDITTTTTTDTTTTVTTTVTPITIYETTTTTEMHRGAPVSNGRKLDPIVDVAEETVVGTPVTSQTSDTVTQTETSTSTVVVDSITTTTVTPLGGWHSPF